MFEFRENENRSFGRQPGGARGAGDDYKKPSKPDPLLESLEALAAMGALEDDRILQEYVRVLTKHSNFQCEYEML